MSNGKGRDDYIVINKRKLEDYFFTSILCLAVLLFIVFMVKGMINIKNQPEGINPDLVSYYQDNNLNIMYPIPGGDWVMAQYDEEYTAFADEVINASKGEDSIFDIHTDMLSEEMVSLSCFVDDGVEGYRQYMTFSFKQNTGYNEENFKEYCEGSLKRDIMGETEGDGEPYKNYKLISSAIDENGGALLKSVVTVEREITNEDGTTLKEDFDLYHTQYAIVVGENIASVTFGSIYEDNTVDEYLVFFLNNIKNVNSLSY